MYDQGTFWGRNLSSTWATFTPTTEQLHPQIALSSRPVPKPAPCQPCRRVSTPRTWGGLALSAWCPLHPPLNPHSQAHTHTQSQAHTVTGTHTHRHTHTHALALWNPDNCSWACQSTAGRRPSETGCPAFITATPTTSATRLPKTWCSPLSQLTLVHTCPDFFKILNPYLPHFYNLGWNKGWLCAI